MKARRPSRKQVELYEEVIEEENFIEKRGFLWHVWPFRCFSSLLPGAKTPLRAGSVEDVKRFGVEAHCDGQMTPDDMPGAIGNIGRKMSATTKACFEPLEWRSRF